MKFVDHYDLPQNVDKYLSNPPTTDVVNIPCPLYLSLAFQRTYHLMQTAVKKTTKSSIASCCISRGLTILSSESNIQSMLSIVSRIHETNYSANDYEFLIHSLGSLKITLPSDRSSSITTRISQQVIGRIHDQADVLSTSPKKLAAFSLAMVLSTQAYPQKQHREQMIDAVEKVLLRVEGKVGLGGPVVQAVDDIE